MNPYVYDFDKIPAELKSLKQWVLWKLEKTVNSKGEVKYTKPPYQKDGIKASTINNAHWSTFNGVVRVFKAGGYDGIGFVFTGTQYIGIDLDECIDESGNLSPMAADIVRRLDSYTEYSYSKEGLHIICKGKLPDGERRNKKNGIEMYGDGSPHYFVMTGDIYDG